MDDVKRKALIETLKSLGRGLWFGILGLVAVALTALASSGAVNDITVTVGGLTVNLAVIVVAVVGFVAKAIDKYIHEDKTIDSNGIAPTFLQK
jgi:drug/metabolite transporter (DMT)-like permease